jgi:hypothetical protein
VIIKKSTWCLKASSEVNIMYCIVGAKAGMRKLGPGISHGGYREIWAITGLYDRGHILGPTVNTNVCVYIGIVI